MSTFKCPHCKAEHDISDYPDHVTDSYDTFWFDCKCGAKFECFYDWNPVVLPIRSTVVLPELDPDRLREDRAAIRAMGESE
jgi:hypothetical protein